MSNTEVILVNEADEATGRMEKMEAHRKGLLHRAFSIFLFDRQGNMLLQQRAAAKYHGGLLWTNACCSHPFPGETVEAAAERRLQEELGFSTRLTKIFSFTYRAEVEHGLTEYEFDHVFAGTYEGPILADSAEVAATKYISMAELEKELMTAPQTFTTWFRIAFAQVLEWWKEHYGMHLPAKDIQKS